MMEQLRFFYIIADTILTAPLERYRHKEARRWLHPGKIKYVGINVYTYRKYYLRNLDEANYYIRMGARLFGECRSYWERNMVNFFDYITYEYKFFLIDMDRYPFWLRKQYTKKKLNRLKMWWLFFLSEKKQMYFERLEANKIEEMEKIILDHNIWLYMSKNIKNEKKMYSIMEENIWKKINQKYGVRDKNGKKLDMLNMHIFQYIIKKLEKKRAYLRYKYYKKGKRVRQKMATYDYLILRKLRKKLWKEWDYHMFDTIGLFSRKKKNLKEMRYFYIKKLKLFKKLGSRGEYVGKRVDERKLKLSKYYDFTKRSGRAFGERKRNWVLGWKRWARKRKIFMRGSLVYRMLKREELFVKSYYKIDRTQKLGRNRIHAVRSRKLFIKRWFAFRNRKYIPKKFIGKKEYAKKHYGKIPLKETSIALRFALYFPWMDIPLLEDEIEDFERKKADYKGKKISYIRNTE